MQYQLPESQVCITIHLFVLVKKFSVGSTAVKTSCFKYATLIRSHQSQILLEFPSMALENIIHIKKRRNCIYKKGQMSQMCTLIQFCWSINICFYRNYIKLNVYLWDAMQCILIHLNQNKDDFVFLRKTKLFMFEHFNSVQYCWDKVSFLVMNIRFVSLQSLRYNN